MCQEENEKSPSPCITALRGVITRVNVRPRPRAPTRDEWNRGQPEKQIFLSPNYDGPSIMVIGYKHMRIARHHFYPFV